MTFGRFAIFAALALMLCVAACHKAPKPSTALTPSHPKLDKDIKVSPGKLPEAWPDWLSTYPKAQIVEGRSSMNSGVPVLACDMRTADDSSKVLDFYGNLIIGKNFAVVSSSQVAGEAVTVYRRENQSLSISAHRSKMVGQTDVEVTLVGTYDAPATPPVGGSTPPSRSDSSGTAGAPPPQGGEQPDPSANPDMPIYPGSQPERPQAQAGQLLLRMTTSDTKEKVLDFYEKFYKDHGFKSTGRMNTGQQLSSTFQGPDGTVYLTAGNATLGQASGKGSTLINLVLNTKIKGY